jgi:hypothetical protein
VGDLNHDGMLDLVVARADQDSVTVLLGTGTGDFTQAPGSPFAADPTVSARNKRSLFLVDVDEDGNLDVITANGLHSGFSTLLGDGRGGFSPGPPGMIPFASGIGFHFFAFGDVNGDGHVDALTVINTPPSGPGDGLLVIQYGDGSGVFFDSPRPPLTLPANPRTLAVADMNGDGRLDIVLSHGGGQLTVLLNQGDETFTASPGSPYALDSPDVGLITADVDGDGVMDVVAACGSTVRVFLGRSQGLVPAPGSPFAAGPGSYFAAVGDIDNDGAADIAASSFEGDEVTILLGRRGSDRR